VQYDARIMSKALKNIWNDPVWSKVIAAIITSLFVYLGSMISKNLLLSICFVLAAIAVFASVVLLARAISGLTVNIESHFLSGGSYGGGPIIFQSFMFQGRNKSKRAIGKISGFVQSTLTNEIYRIYFNIEGVLVPPEETNGIPAKAEFCIVVPFVRDMAGEYVRRINGEWDANQGIDRKKLMENLSDSIFEMEADGRRYRYRIKRTKMQLEIEQMQNRIDPPKGTRMSRKIRLSDSIKE
jgi:hypothetical protein